MKGNGSKKTMLMALLIPLTILSLLLIFLLFRSGALVKPSYLEAWKKEHYQKYSDPRLQLASHGLLAANSHNMQAWSIRLDENDPQAFYLFVNTDRLTPEVDPYARQTLISQGTFLEYLQQAGEALGYPCQITLFPDGPLDESRLIESMKEKAVAKIIFETKDPIQNPLYSHIFRPDTHRGPYIDQVLTSEEIKQLEATNSDHELLSIEVIQDPARVKRLNDYAWQAAEIEAGISRIAQESTPLLRVNEYEKNRKAYGFSLDGQGMKGLPKHLLQGILSTFPSMNNEKASSDAFLKSMRQAVDHAPTYVLIRSRQNFRLEQVFSGISYSRLVLTAHEMGMVVHPVSQILQEYPEMSQLYQEIHSEFAPSGETIQMLVRIGKAETPAPLSMRSTVDRLLIK